MLHRSPALRRKSAPRDETELAARCADSTYVHEWCPEKQSGRAGVGATYGGSTVAAIQVRVPASQPGHSRHSALRANTAIPRWGNPPSPWEVDGGSIQYFLSPGGYGGERPMQGLLPDAKLVCVTGGHTLCISPIQGTNEQSMRLFMSQSSPDCQLLGHPKIEGDNASASVVTLAMDPNEGYGDTSTPLQQTKPLVPMQPCNGMQSILKRRRSRMAEWQPVGGWMDGCGRVCSVGPIWEGGGVGVPFSLRIVFSGGIAQSMVIVSVSFKGVY
uniref:Uncharacterized protein 49D12.050 n=1 Tax=Neurospora crassa TaxID=5141 RepID=Q870P8_NEUCS|nr:hypothetical protein [Neurospora crassa]